MNKILKCHAIIPIRGDEIKLRDLDETNTFVDSDDNLFIVSGCVEHNSFTDFNGNMIVDFNGNLIVLSSVVPDVYTFWKRLAFCWRLLFKY